MAKGDVSRAAMRPDTLAQQAIRRNLAERAVEARPVPTTSVDNTTGKPVEKPRQSLAEQHDRAMQPARTDSPAARNLIAEIPAKDHYRDLRSVEFPTVNQHYLRRVNTTSEIRELGTSPSGHGKLFVGKTENIERFIEQSILPRHSTIFGHGSDREYQLPDGNIVKEHTLQYSFVVPGEGVGRGIERYTRITDPITVQTEKEGAKAIIQAFLNRSGD